MTQFIKHTPKLYAERYRPLGLIINKEDINKTNTNLKLTVSSELASLTIQ